MVPVLLHDDLSDVLRPDRRLPGLARLAVLGLGALRLGPRRRRRPGPRRAARRRPRAGPAPRRRRRPGGGLRGRAARAAARRHALVLPLPAVVLPAGDARRAGSRRDAARTGDRARRAAGPAALRPSCGTSRRSPTRGSPTSSSTRTTPTLLAGGAAALLGRASRSSTRRWRWCPMWLARVLGGEAGYDTAFGLLMGACARGLRCRPSDRLGGPPGGLGVRADAAARRRGAAHALRPVRGRRAARGAWRRCGRGATARRSRCSGWRR